MRLFEYAFVPPQTQWLEQIAQKAVKENWGPNNSYLEAYCQANFEIAHAQNLVYKDTEDRFSLWRIGHLTTSDGTPIYAYFVRNPIEGRQPCRLVAVLVTRNIVVRYKPDRAAAEERIAISNPPAEPVYAVPPYHPEYKVEYNWEHFLKEHKTRLEQSLPGIQDRVLYLCIFGAVELSHRLFKMNSVPQYHHGHYQFLLPLYVTHEDHTRKPDLVAPLDEDNDRGVYVVKTLLPPGWAYPNARCIATNIAQFRSWIENP